MCIPAGGAGFPTAESDSARSMDVFGELSEAFGGFQAQAGSSYFACRDTPLNCESPHEIPIEYVFGL